MRENDIDRSCDSIAYLRELLLQELQLLAELVANANRLRNRRGRRFTLVPLELFLLENDSSISSR